MKRAHVQSLECSFALAICFDKESTGAIRLTYETSFKKQSASRAGGQPALGVAGCCSNVT
jgi:hypothetical protein